jgi:DNA repair protein RadD
LWEEEFTSIEDQQIVDDLRERMKLLGLDSSQVEEIVKNAKPGAVIKRPASQSVPIQPQRALMEARKRVGEQASRLAKILLNHVGLTMEGREIPYKYKSLGLTGRTNFVAAVMMVNHEINQRLGKDREICSAEDFKVILDSLDDILQTAAKRVRKAKTEHEKHQA